MEFSLFFYQQLLPCHHNREENLSDLRILEILDFRNLEFEL